MEAPEKAERVLASGDARADAFDCAATPACGRRTDSAAAHGPLCLATSRLRRALQRIKYWGIREDEEERTTAWAERRDALATEARATTLVEASAFILRK